MRDFHRCRSWPSSREVHLLLLQQSDYQSGGTHELQRRFAVLRRWFAPSSVSFVHFAHPQHRRDGERVCALGAAFGNLLKLLVSTGQLESHNNDHHSHNACDGDNPIDHGTLRDTDGCSLR